VPRLERNQRIAELYRDGAPTALISERYGVNRNYVCRIGRDAFGRRPQNRAKNRQLVNLSDEALAVAGAAAEARGLVARDIINWVLRLTLSDRNFLENILDDEIPERVTQ
jgi:hypothetical protein